MPVPSSGVISLNDFHVEAGGTSGTQCSINDSDIRGLIGKGSGVQMSFNEWYGASGTDNSAVISTAQTSVTTPGKYGTTTYYYGFKTSAGSIINVGTAIGSSSNNDFEVNGNSFDLLGLISTTGGMFDNNILEISGNYNGSTLQQVTGFRYLKNGSNVILDSTWYSISGVSATGAYDSNYNSTTWYYLVATGSAGYAQSRTMTSSGTMNLSFSN